VKLRQELEEDADPKVALPRLPTLPYVSPPLVPLADPEVEMPRVVLCDFAEGADVVEYVVGSKYCDSVDAYGEEVNFDPKGPPQKRAFKTDSSPLLAPLGFFDLDPHDWSSCGGAPGGPPPEEFLLLDDDGYECDADDAGGAATPRPGA